jgi:hypothetical protein
MEMRNFLSSLFIFSQPNATKYQDKYAHHTESSEPNADIFHISYEKIICTLTRYVATIMEKSGWKNNSM